MELIKGIYGKSPDCTTVEEWYGDNYTCRECKEELIWNNFNYCPNCGVKIEWIAEPKEEIKL